jgi:hypothetical protein
VGVRAQIIANDTEAGRSVEPGNRPDCASRLGWIVCHAEPACLDLASGQPFTSGALVPPGFSDAIAQITVGVAPARERRNEDARNEGAE